ncbi:hypothetical protein [Prauserella alba]|uniref:Uncharacterized protein n=1 Tax=Prauserella alba TaxID=176898 RepID=A0ABP4FWY1_9PSEU|nr:hypothetical protein [Prauserella alba]MCP2181520.1 hypothetical protein [Prauserella alba]
MTDDDKIHEDGRARRTGQGAAEGRGAANHGAAPGRPGAADAGPGGRAAGHGAAATGGATTGAAATGAAATGGAATGGAADPADDEKDKTGLRPAPVIAGGVAATTAAFLCSFFGVYGTVIGAGAISVLSTVGSELYLRSLRRSREAARKAKAKAAALAEAKTGGRARDRTAVIRRPTTMPGAAHGQTEPTTRRILSNADQPTDRLPVGGFPAPQQARGEVDAAKDTSAGMRGLLRRRWPVLAATSVVVFGIGMLVLTGFELATGGSLNGQGRSTVSAIIGDRDSSDSRDDGRDGRDGGDAPATPGDDAPAEPADPTGEATPTEEAPQPSEEQGEQPGGDQPTEEPEPTDEPTEVEQPTVTPEQPAEPEEDAATPAP